MLSFIIWDIDPQVFSGFGLLRWYGLCWMVGMIVGYRIVFHIYKKEGIPVTEMDNLTIYVVLGAVLGARLGHVFFYEPAYYLAHPIEILPIKLEPSFQFTGFSGLASHGGILAVLLALYFYKRRYKKDYLWLLDRLMIGGAALAGFIRLGNLMNSEILGLPSNAPWAFVFTRVDQVPRHPAQLYEALFYWAICIALFYVWRSRRFQHNAGFIFGLGMALIFIQRFLVEFLKENQVAFEDGLALNMGQSLSIPLVLAGLVMMVWSLKRAPKPPAFPAAA
ncbi:MAG TPA: prolipoprotein diacylglyceryl transferase [Cytophagales bacterium]|nr:prolipoprotein diacylglyceryl transferase [Cytophagales bacterium]HAA22062.1 prolipoprotein diacylglyceryl transferase [Cytophagales bacterium]HAP60810.1 prolipoprotein diacylglyceryl transferase [Cytophagales bacterium]